MVILGIDPGYATVGFGVVEHKGNLFRTIDYGAITTPAKTDFVLRLETIFDEISSICDMFKPDAASVEELFFTHNQKTAIAVGQSRGVILLALKKKGVPVFEYTPLQVKQSVVGYGRAEKNQIMAMTKTMLNLDTIPRPDDAADALALAICHAHSSKSRLLDIY